jgi:hypothetical protein
MASDPPDAERITWTNGVRRLGDLVPWEHNPRQIKEAEAGRLLDSLETFGQFQTIAIEPDNEIVDGHQRRAVWAVAEKYGLDFQVDVRIANRKLTEWEKQQLSIYAHKGAVGEFDFDELASWGIEDKLLDWGFKGWELGIQNDIDYDKLWQGMPEFEQEDLSPVKTISVHFASWEDVKAFSELMRQTITEKTKYIWYPKKERENLKEHIWRDES